MAKSSETEALWTVQVDGSTTTFWHVYDSSVEEVREEDVCIGMAPILCSLVALAQCNMLGWPHHQLVGQLPMMERIIAMSNGIIKPKDPNTLGYFVWAMHVMVMSRQGI